MNATIRFTMTVVLVISGLLMAAHTQSASAVRPVLPQAVGSDTEAGALPIRAAPIRIKRYRAYLDAGVFLSEGDMAVASRLELRAPFMSGWPETNRAGNTVHWGFLLDPAVKADFAYMLGDAPDILRIRAEATGFGLLRRHSVSRDRTLGTEVSPEYRRIRSLGLTRSTRGSRRARLHSVLERCSQPNAPKICAALGELNQISHDIGRGHSTSEIILGHIGFLYEDDKSLGIKNMAIALDTVVFAAHKALALGSLRVELCGKVQPAGWYISVGDSTMAERDTSAAKFRMSAEVCAGMMLGSFGTLRNTFGMEYLTGSATMTSRPEEGGPEEKSTGDASLVRMYNSLSLERIGNWPLGLFYRLELPAVEATGADPNAVDYMAHVAGLRGTF